MREHAKKLLVLGGAALLAGLVAGPERRPQAAVTLPEDDNLCAQEAVPTRAEGTSLSTLTSTGLEGMTYDTVTGELVLSQSGGGAGAMVPEGMSLDDVFIACAADFNEDGWTDFVATDESSPEFAGVGFLKLYVNQTSTTAVPDWNNPSESRDPSFVATTTIEATALKKGTGSMVCGDINGDGHQDFLLLRCSTGRSCAIAGRADAFLGNGDGTFQPPYQFLSSLSLGATLNDDGTHMLLYDVNKDGFKDVVVGMTGAAGGEITAFYNNQASPPQFTTAVTLVDSTGATGTFYYGITGMAIADFTNDGKDDLVFGALDSTELKLIIGTDTGFDGGMQSIDFPAGYAVNVFAGDFARAGRADLIVVNDGLVAYLYANDGDSQPFSGPPTTTMSPGGSPTDTWDAAVIMDYDHDPQNTPDLIVANGNQDSQTFVYANRPGATTVDCGRATSGVIATPELDTVDGTVTAVRLSPEPATPTEGTWTFEASNDDGVTWHPAPPCADDETDFCADVSSTTGRDVRWRVTMCANAEQTAGPTMNAVETRYTYVLASTHFRAGPVMRDDVIYIGAVREPGHEGKFLAIDNASGTVLWDAADKLDAMSPESRHIYSESLLSGRVLLGALTLLDAIDVLNVLDLLQGTQLYDWLVSKRFGTVAPRTLGGVLNSTAAVLSAPGRPYFVGLDSTPQSEKDLIEDHITAVEGRQHLVFVGSQTGMLHAFYTNPTDPSDPKNGQEAWAWVPRNIGRRLLGDKTDDKVTAFVDGSPTLATAKISGAYRSVLVMGEGTGGDEVFALDVTETVDPDTGTVLGPALLWRFTDSNMGVTVSKPAVIRTLIEGTETWLAVFASGPDESGDKGDTLYAVNMDSGTLEWKFDIGDSDTYISTDITAVDEESGDPDGYISRIYFGDNKGRLWKLDPTVFSSSVASPVGSNVDVGLGKDALFSTRVTADALGEDRAISANIIAVPDAAKRLVLYFGTGGTAETAPGETNAFYAVFGDTGEIRSQIDITGARYNGASYQDGQIVFATSDIPETAGPCVVSNSEIVAIDAQTFALQFFQEFEGAIASPVYISGGEIFAVTVTGKLVTSQYTGNNAPQAAAAPPPEGEPAEVNEEGALHTGFTILGWRQTY